MNRLSEAEDAFRRANESNERLIKSPFYTVRNNIERARLRKKQGRLAEGIVFAHRAEALALTQGSPLNYKDCLEVLSQLYEASHDLERAIGYQKQLSVLQDSIARAEQSRKVTEAETRFWLGEKTRELDVLAKENELQKVKQRSDRIVMVALGSGLAVLILAAAISVVAYGRAKAKNQLLAAQKAEIEQASRLIGEQAEKLQLADKMKSRFFANISHELRTPLTLITGMLELIFEKNSDPAERGKLKVALGNSRKLNALVEEMIDLTRVEANKVKLNVKKLQPYLLLNGVLDTFSSLLENKEIQLTKDLSALESVYAEIDEDKFEKIISNLIYNAIKFTPAHGWIRVDGRVTDGENKIEISISDSGIGIPETDIPHIFERFYQSESGTQKNNYKGTGIGLSIVREFTQLHGGEVTVSSVEGQGTTFLLHFPVASPGQAVEDDEHDTTEAIFSWATIETEPVVLLVEDHPEMRIYLAELLGKNFKLMEASNGKDALQLLNQNEVDLIISDVMMPVMNGFEFLEQLKKNENLRRIPVVMLTARAAQEDKLHGLGLGVDDYIVKPFDAQELRVRVNNLLVNQHNRKQWLIQHREMLTDVSGDAELFSDTQEKQFLDEVTNYVESRMQDPLIAVGDLASHLALSERQLYRKVGELTGLAPAQLIKEIRLKKAYQLLIDKKVSKLASLASEVGYESTAYFSRQFTERFGKRPTEFL